SDLLVNSIALKEIILAYSFENHHHLISIQLNHLVYQIEHQLMKVIRSPSNQDLLKLPNDLVDSMYKIVLHTSGVGLHLLLLSLHLLNSHGFFLFNIVVILSEQNRYTTTDSFVDFHQFQSSNLHVPA